ncbi:hypothetical protein [Streptomyces sp. NPDC012746]|uniref:hypothetical protein n=1 Tax=Streptomyces sp. NPDC012746 TaxID=3364845 RepID=UPI0036ACEC66
MNTAEPDPTPPAPTRPDPARPAPTPPAEAPAPPAARNGPARVSAFFALASVASAANFVTGIAWINPAVFLAMTALCALTAVPVGHMGRFRARRLAGEGKGTALAAILVGWTMLFVCALAVLAFAGLIAGMAFLTENA